MKKAKFVSADSAAPDEILWVVEYTRQPEDDPGCQTLFGPFKEFDDARKFGKDEFGMNGRYPKNWVCRSIWPVYKI